MKVWRRLQRSRAYNVVLITLTIVLLWLIIRVIPTRQSYPVEDVLQSTSFQQKISSVCDKLSWARAQPIAVSEAVMTPNEFAQQAFTGACTPAIVQAARDVGVKPGHAAGDYTLWQRHMDQIQFDGKTLPAPPQVIPQLGQCACSTMSGTSNLLSAALHIPLLDELLARRVRDNLLYVSVWGTNGDATMSKHFARMMEHAGLDNYVIIAGTERHLQACRTHNIECFDASSLCLMLPLCWRDLSSCMELPFVHQVIQRGVDVMMTDIDTVWLHPYPEQYRNDSMAVTPYAVPTDQKWDFSTWKDTLSLTAQDACFGMFYVSSNPEMVAFWGEFMRLAALDFTAAAYMQVVPYGMEQPDNWMCDDQRVWNNLAVPTILQEYFDGVVSGGALTPERRTKAPTGRFFRRLPPPEFLQTYSLFWAAYPKILDEVIAIHMVGFGHDKHWGLRERHLFHGDDDVWFSGKFLRYGWQSVRGASKGEDGYKAFIVALYIASACNRSLILPSWRCSESQYLERSGKDRDDWCIFNVRYQYRAIAAEFDVRESAFLQNPKARHLAENTIQVPTAGAGLHNLVSSCSSHESYSVIDLSSAPLVELWDDVPFQDPKQLSFSARIDKSVIEEDHLHGCC